VVTPIAATRRDFPLSFWNRAGLIAAAGDAPTNQRAGRAEFADFLIGGTAATARARHALIGAVKRGGWNGYRTLGRETL